MRNAKHQTCGAIYNCQDCDKRLTVRYDGGLGFGGGSVDYEWFMLKDRVWALTQRAGKCRFLCVGCVERRIRRKLSADDFRRSSKVNFTHKHSLVLRRRMRGLKPAKRLIETRFTP